MPLWGDGHVKLAAAVEFMHTATLLHDDVVDESDMRRGKLAARMLWGNEASVLVGDFLLGQAFRMMVEVGSLPCLSVLADAAAVIAEGEVMQISAAKDTATTEDDYVAVIRAKTAALFAAACEVGPILAGKSKAEMSACRAYGTNLGIAFQLIDDALDYGGSSSTLGKNVGDDFREGKITLPVVLSFRRGSGTSASSGPARWPRVKSPTAISKRRSARCGAIAPSKTRSSGRGITAPWRATRWNSSRPRITSKPCSTSWTSAFAGRAERIRVDLSTKSGRTTRRRSTD